jgi:hypothetical protein
MKYLKEIDHDQTLVDVLEIKFSLHNADQIYNLISKFAEYDSKDDNTLDGDNFNEWLRKEGLNE